MGTDFNYDDANHQVIFDSINGGARSGPLQEASRAWQQLGDDIGVTGKSYVQGAISDILTSREGVAATAATAAISAMLPWMDGVARIATITAQRAQNQADYWVTAQRNVPPVPPPPQPTGFFDHPTEWVAEKMDWLPGVHSDEEAAQKHRQDAAEQARQAMRVYFSPAPTTISPRAGLHRAAGDRRGSGLLSLEGISMRGATVELTHEEYRTVWHALGLGTRHWNMELPGLPELTEQERRARAGSALDGVRARGLPDHRGMAPELEDSLRLLASPVQEINGWVQSGADQVRLLAGSRGEWAALAMLDEHRLLVRTGPASELCTAVARQLPDRPAGPGSSVSVPSELLAHPSTAGGPG